MINPSIKVTSTIKGQKVESWVCFGEKPKSISVSVIGGPEYLINLKSLVKALKANNLVK